MNNLNPFRYLTHILTILKDHQDDTDYSFIEELLPWSDQLPEICRSNLKQRYVNRTAGNGGQKMEQYAWFTVYDKVCELPITNLRTFLVSNTLKEMNDSPYKYNTMY